MATLATRCTLFWGLIFLSLVCVGAELPDRKQFGEQFKMLEQVPAAALKLGAPYADDLKIEIWAQSPMVFSPVAMDVDGQGRMWVTEGMNYKRSKHVTTGQSIVVLSDTDQDGTADRSHIFVEEKEMWHTPLGIAVFDNRIVLSSTPEIIIYTDVNRNAIFEPGIDKREIFLTGFRGPGRDHGVHAVVGGPSGQWYFSFGNCGAELTTKDGRHFRSASYYMGSSLIGQASSDGEVWIGGLAMRINPDGTGLTTFAHNLRNTHDMAVSSLGDIFHSDNDDPSHCRSTWLMEYANAGYSDIRDGRSSWEEIAKSWQETSKHGRFSRRSPVSHWRQNYPGSLPAGSVYGSGAPVGQVLIEGDELGAACRGLFLSCDMVRKDVMVNRPQLQGAHYEMGENKPFISLATDERKRFFLPSDVVVGTDGSLFLADFHNNTSTTNRQVSGTIYRISRKDNSQPRAVAIDYSTMPGLVAALRSPSSSIRVVAVNQLVARGEDAVEPMRQLLQTAKNPYVRARPIWVLAQLGESGRRIVRALLDSTDVLHRIVAYRALRYAVPDELEAMARKLAGDDHPAVRREVALSLRRMDYTRSRPILTQLINGYDGSDRWYLEAIGTAVIGREADVYRDIVRPMASGIPFAKWDERLTNLAWRLHTPEAIDDLDRVIRARPPEIERFRTLAMAYASFDGEKARVDYRRKFLELASLPEFAGDAYQSSIAEIARKDLANMPGESLTANYLVPQQFGQSTEVSDVATISALKGNASRGGTLAQRCLACHVIKGQGIAFGPRLTDWGRYRTVAQIVEDLVNPSAHLAHGFDKPVRLRKGDFVAEGFLSNYSYHAGSLKIKLFGGQSKKIIFRANGVKVEELKDHSWMPPAAKMGLADQDVRDVAAYLRSLGDDIAAEGRVGAKAGFDDMLADGTLKNWKNTGDYVLRDGILSGTNGQLFSLEKYADFILRFEFKFSTEKSTNNGLAIRSRMGQRAIELQIIDDTTEAHKNIKDYQRHGSLYNYVPAKTGHLRKTGEWNSQEVTCVGSVVTVTLNGTVIMKADLQTVTPISEKPVVPYIKDAREGHIGFLGHDSPVFVRSMQIKRLAAGEAK